MKRFFAMMMVLCLTLGLFAACATEGTEQTETTSATQGTEQTAASENATEPSETVEATKPVPVNTTLTVYHSLNDAVAYRLDECLETFRQAHPQWEIRLVKLTGGVMAAGGVVICTAEEVADLSAKQLLQELDSMLIKEDESLLADLYPNYVEEGKQYESGKTHALPIMRTSLGLYYNYGYFDMNGLMTPFTWDEMEQLCAKIKEQNPDATPLVCAEPAELFITLCAQNQSTYLQAGDDPFAFDNSKNREFVKEFNAWVNKGYLTTDLEAWNNGSACMLIGYGADALRYRAPMGAEGYLFETDITLLPQADLVAPAVISRGYDICLLKTGDDALTQISWELAKYMATDVQFQATFPAEAGYAPMSMAAEAEDVYNDFINAADGGDNIVNLGAFASLSQQMICNTVPVYAGSATAREQVQIMMEKCLQPNADIAAAFQEAVAACKG